MSRIRFSLLGLVLATGAIAVACAALVRATDWMADLAWAGTLLLLTFTLLCALLLAPSRRGCWVGFSLFGWMYVVLACSPLADRPNVPSLVPLLRQAAEAMPQAKGLEAVTITVDPADPAKAYALTADLILLNEANSNSIEAALKYVGRAQAVGKTDFIESFIRISQALMTVLLAALGGLTGHLIRQRSPAAG